LVCKKINAELEPLFRKEPKSLRKLYRLQLKFFAKFD